jgi:YihY family inner membrane protein
MSLRSPPSSPGKEPQCCSDDDDPQHRMHHYSESCRDDDDDDRHDDVEEHVECLPRWRHFNLPERPLSKRKLIVSAFRSVGSGNWNRMNAIERTARRVDEFQQSHTPVAFPFAVTKKFGDDNAGVLVSNLAYSGFVALLPLFLVLITILGIVLSGDPALRHSVTTSTFAEFPIVGNQLGDNIHALHRDSVVGLVIGLVGLLWGSMGMSQAGLFAMSQIWNLPGPERPNYLKRIGRSLSFLVVLGFGLVTSTFLAGFGTFGKHNILLGVLGEALAVVINVIQYLLAFRVLTPKSVETKKLVPGALVGAAAWTVLQAVGGYLIGHDLRNDSAIYGLFGMVLGLLAWVYLGAEISIYSAELNTVIARHLWPKAMVQPPLTPADQRSMELQATENQRRPEQTVDVSFTKEPATQREFRLQKVAKESSGDVSSH